MSTQEYQGDLQSVIYANKMSGSAFVLIGILERLGLMSARYTHQDEIRTYVYNAAAKRHQALIEIFTLEDDV